MSKRGEKLDMFGGGNDLQSVSDAIYGSSDIPESGRVVARPTPIHQIWADPKQPRRAIPLSIRLHWDGSPDSVADLLNDWLMVAQQMIGEKLDMVALLKGEGDGLDSDKFPSVAQEFLSLARLAANIQADGLINPITVIESDDKLVIESGERRWLAYHLLNRFMGDEFSKIPAAKGKFGDSVWRQATENTARRQLNPIGMARQIALLIMAARGTPPLEVGQAYKEYEQIVTHGVSDRRFYAQVADGNAHRIPKGMGERIQAAMGLGMEQISQYRNLLRLTNDELVNDVLWTRADIENWPEGWLREIRTLTPVKVSEVLQRSEWTIDDLRALKDVPVDRPPSVSQAAPEPTKMPVPAEWLGKHVRHIHKGISGVVVEVYKDHISFRRDDNGLRDTFPASELVFMAPPKPAPQAAPAPTVTFEVGDTVKTRLGNVGTVTAVNGRLVSLNVPGRGSTTQYADQLTLVSIPPQINEEDIEDDVDPEAAAPPREWREGWTDGEGGNNQASSDKTDSQTEPRLIVRPESSAAKAYEYFRLAFTELGDFETARIFKIMCEATDQAVREIGSVEQRTQQLNLIYEQASKGCNSLITGPLAEDLRRMEEVI